MAATERWRRIVKEYKHNDNSIAQLKILTAHKKNHAHCLDQDGKRWWGNHTQAPINLPQTTLLIYLDGFLRQFAQYLNMYRTREIVSEPALLKPDRSRARTPLYWRYSKPHLYTQIHLDLQGATTIPIRQDLGATFTIFVPGLISKCRPYFKMLQVYRVAPLRGATFYGENWR